MASQKKTIVIALAFAAIMMVAGVLAILTSTKSIPSSGKIDPYKVVAYEDSGYTTEVSTWVFDAITPGGYTTKTVYIKNNSTNLKMMLSMDTGSTNTWSATPPNSTYNLATLTWDYDNTALDPQAYRTVILTLTDLDTAISRNGYTFTVTIRIIGTETA